jgi:hypothetical protein
LVVMDRDGSGQRRRGDQRDHDEQQGVGGEVQLHAAALPAA